jgi:integrase
LGVSGRDIAATEWSSGARINRTRSDLGSHLFKRLDFGVDDFAPHGLRATGATLLREHGFSRDVVELLPAHKERNPTTAAYHHHELADERRRAVSML